MILTLWKLGRRTGQFYNPKTESVLRRLRNATVEAAVPPAICAILNIVVYLVLVSQYIGTLWLGHPGIRER